MSRFALFFKYTTPGTRVAIAVTALALGMIIGGAIGSIIRETVLR